MNTRIIESGQPAAPISTDRSEDFIEAPGDPKVFSEDPIRRMACPVLEKLIQGSQLPPGPWYGHDSSI